MKKTILLLCLFTFTISNPIFAGEAEDKGLAIAKERKLRDKGWQDLQAEMVMTLKNKHGKESSRHIRIKNLEVRLSWRELLTDHIFFAERIITVTICILCNMY